MMAKERATLWVELGSTGVRQALALILTPARRGAVPDLLVGSVKAQQDGFSYTTSAQWKTWRKHWNVALRSHAPGMSVIEIQGRVSQLFDYGEIRRQIEVFGEVLARALNSVVWQCTTCGTRLVGTDAERRPCSCGRDLAKLSKPEPVAVQPVRTPNAPRHAAHVESRRGQVAATNRGIRGQPPLWAWLARNELLVLNMESVDDRERLGIRPPERVLCQFAIKQWVPYMYFTVSTGSHWGRDQSPQMMKVLKEYDLEWVLDCKDEIPQWFERLLVVTDRRSLVVGGNTYIRERRSGIHRSEAASGPEADAGWTRFAWAEQIDGSLSETHHGDIHQIVAEEWSALESILERHGRWNPRSL